ncbi:probable serine/threonine-protein kinase drkD [Symsagittifera roscoffensis]|uniref:probable serine/threonine-protein kinase drkD n=1 Tax=Symsagittifera roscoffensis TaxID=84072 RepID=UPI00307C059E
MIEKIKQQLAQFELGMPTASTRMASSDQQTLPARLTGHSRARTVASAKMANHKNTPVREVEPMGSQLAPAKAANKAKTLMSLKASMAEQDMVKNLQKQQTQYKQQIRHLERELKRLKQNDVMSSCELNIEDLQFSEEDFLGDGAFADVFYGLYSGKGVAIKRLKGLLSSSDESYFNAEVSLLRELRHPNVVLLLGVCRDREGRPLMVLEYMENGSLFSVLHDFERSGLDHVAFYQISKDTVIGMNYLHKHKPGPVLHLDLKSMNVLLDEYGKAKIADFGFSKLKSNTDSGSENQLSVESRKGSPAWMAPETLQQGKVSTKSDVYSFGIILWEMLTREKPYEGMGLFQVMEGVAKKGLRPVIPGWVPKELTSLINLCWHAQPSQRPSFQEVLDILDNLHLPPEWKSLLDAAGVPRIVLEDPEVTRSIVEFVHLSLNVSDSSSSIPTSGGGLSESMIDQERQMIDLEVVSAFEMLTRKQKEKSYRTLVPALSSLASSVGDDRDRSDVNNDISDVWDIQVHSTPVAEDSDTPRALSQMEKSKEDLKITELYTHESRPRTVIGSSAEPIRSQISEDVLRNQKAKLRPTTVAPHPSQLANLASVDEGKLNTIAAVIKQALNDRREFMLDDTSSERGEDDRSSMMGGDTTRRTDDDVTRNK